MDTAVKLALRPSHAQAVAQASTKTPLVNVSPVIPAVLPVTDLEMALASVARLFVNLLLRVSAFVSVK